MYFKNHSYLTKNLLTNKTTLNFESIDSISILFWKLLAAENYSWWMDFLMLRGENVIKYLLSEPNGIEISSFPNNITWLNQKISKRKNSK